MSINSYIGSSELTYSVYQLTGGPTLVGGGSAKFENGIFTYLTDNYKCAKSKPASYEIYITKEDKFITGMRQKLIGEDECPDRIESAGSDFFYYSGLGDMPIATERAPKTGVELFGYWYTRTGVLWNFQLGKIDPSTGTTDVVTTIYYTHTDPWMDMGKGTGRFEKGILTFLTNEGFCVGSAETDYAITMIVHDDKVTGFYPEQVGKDPCWDRMDLIEKQFIRRVIN
jgi:hypothetical protein